jgi:hemoglobin
MMKVSDSLQREQITLLVHRFYDAVRADAELAPVFNTIVGQTWERHLLRMVDFWSTVALGDKSFKGNVYGKHMALDGIRPEHFLRWLTLWHQHTDAELKPEHALALQRVAHGIARNLFYGFFGDFARFIVRDGVAISWEAEHA